MQYLAQTDRRIAEIKAHITRQRLLVTRRLAAGHPSELAETTLGLLEENLRIFERHRQSDARSATPMVQITRITRAPRPAGCSTDGPRLGTTQWQARHDQLTNAWRRAFPQIPTSCPSGDLWLHEIKHDGFRVMARKDGDRVRLYSRPGNDLPGASSFQRPRNPPLLPP